MANIRQETGNILEYKTDVIICPCHTDLTYIKDDNLYKKIFARGGKDLQKELSSIGYCAIGNAVITQPYTLPYKKLIFIAYKDPKKQDEPVDHLLLHQAYRSAINLSLLYGIKNLSTSGVPVAVKKQNATQKFTGLFKLETAQPSLNPQETIEIAKTVASEFDDFIEDFVIFE